MATSGQSHKISPRKFSEKIALLNKKEAEGNAEFDRVIKEVQATRCQSACGALASMEYPPDIEVDQSDLFASYVDCCANDGDLVTMDNLTSEQQDELQEVYRNLVKDVKQCDELGEITISENNNNNNNDNFTPLNVDLVAQQQQAVAVVPMTSPSNQSPTSTTTPNNNNNNNNDLNFIPYASLTPKQDQILVATPSQQQQQYPFYAQEAEPSSAVQLPATGRARGTSIGPSSAANYRLLCANAQQPKAAYQICSENQTMSTTNDWFTQNGCNVAQQPVYLKPATYDRCWQKSSSDPALHAPFTPQQQQQQQQHTASATASNLEPANFGLQTAAADQTIVVDTSTNGQETQFSEYIQQQQRQPMVHQQDQYNFILADTSQPADTGSTLQQPTDCYLPPAGGDDDNIEIRGDLPGIKICNIDDDGGAGGGDNSNSSATMQRQFESNDVGLESGQQGAGGGGGGGSRESSLPDLANLQFNGLDKSRDSILTDADGYCHGTNWTMSAASAGGGSQVIMGQYPADSYSGWPAMSATDTCGNGGLYAPVKVNNLLSNSECGLSHQQMLTASDLCEANMIRSHSHNSIDYLARHKTRQLTATINHCDTGQPSHYHYQQHHHNQPQYQYQYHNNNNHHHQHQHHHNQARDGQLANHQPGYGHQHNHLLQTAQQRIKYGGSGSMNSMRPQHGSVSPLDSSSNLTSPQSEQNSPGSSVTEYGEPSTFQQQQQTLIMGPTKEDLADSYLNNSSASTGTGSYQPEAGEANLVCDQQLFGSQQQQQQEAAYMTSQYQQQQPQLIAHDQFRQQQPLASHEGSIGPCQTVSCSRRLQNQASYSMRFSSSTGSMAATGSVANGSAPALAVTRGCGLSTNKN